MRLEDALAPIEERLTALGLALRDGDAASVEAHTQALQRALATAMPGLSSGARQPLSPALQQRLALAGAQVSAQRESLARAGAALERAIGVLMPTQPPSSTYAPGRRVTPHDTRGVSA